MKNITGKWYKCLNCWNYSTIPLECCGETMVEEAEEAETEKHIYENEDSSNEKYIWG